MPKMPTAQDNSIVTVLNLLEGLLSDERVTPHIREEVDEAVTEIHHLWANLGSRDWYHYFEASVVELADVSNLMYIIDEDWAYWFDGAVSNSGFVHWSVFDHVKTAKAALWTARHDFLSR